MKNNSYTFIIDGKTFFCEKNFTTSSRLTIQSSPRPYTATWDTHENPLNNALSLLQKNENNALLIDENLIKIYKPDLTSIPSQKIYLATASESFKTLDGVTDILNFLQKNEFTKGEQLIVVGGGIIQDVGGFVGAIYKRGIPWIYFPTTLLSMCDSCIGGKAGINYNGVKNQVALFSAPHEIYINPHFLQTLSENEIYSGLGEILKLCIIGGNNFIQLYKAHVTNGRVKSFHNFQPLIMAALCIKKAVVEEDEFELNHRRSMNYGHTLGHAIESLSNYQIPHGQAVVVGMFLVNHLSHQQGLLCKSDLIYLNNLCLDLINHEVIACLRKMKFDNLLDLIKQDKKTAGHLTSFVFMQSPGNTCFVKLELNDQLIAHIHAAMADLLHIKRNG